MGDAARNRSATVGSSSPHIRIVFDIAGACLTEYVAHVTASLRHSVAGLPQAPMSCPGIPIRASVSPYRHLMAVPSVMWSYRLAPIHRHTLLLLALLADSVTLMRLSTPCRAVLPFVPPRFASGAHYRTPAYSAKAKGTGRLRHVGRAGGPYAEKGEKFPF